MIGPIRRGFNIAMIDRGGVGSLHVVFVFLGRDLEDDLPEVVDRKIEQ